MLIVMAIVIGGLYAVGFYHLLRGSLVRMLLGLLVLSHAANLLIFTGGGLDRRVPAMVPDGATAPPAGHADPLPQALILTAIVIGLAVLSFAAVLARSAYRSAGTDDVDTLRATDT